MSEGIISAMTLWARRSLLLCALGGARSLLVVSLLTGDTVVTVSGHLAPLSCVATSPANGLFFTGSLDRTVRVWQVAECVPPRMLSTGVVDDPALAALEERVASLPAPARLGSGARQALRGLSSLLSAYIHLSPRWRHGRITGFFDGRRYLSEPPPDADMAAMGVEVAFEDASVQVTRYLISI